MYRLGKKQKRAVLDSNGIEVVVFPKGKELYAELFVEFLNNLDSNDFTQISKKIKIFKLLKQREEIEKEIFLIDANAVIEYELNKLTENEK